MKQRDVDRRRSPKAELSISINFAIGSDVLSARDLVDRVLSAATAAAEIGERSPLHVHGCHAVEAFVSERCERDSGSRETAGDLFAAYCQWAPGASAPSLTSKALGRALAALGFRRGKSGRVFYVGLRLRARGGGPAPGAAVVDRTSHPPKAAS